jgi:hypothetical protein
LQFVLGMSENDFDVSAEIDREQLEIVNGGESTWLTRAADFIGPYAAKYYGEDWDSASCSSRANVAAGGVRNLTVASTGALAFAANKWGGSKAAKIAGSAPFVSDLALDWSRTKTFSHYMSNVCKK